MNQSNYQPSVFADQTLDSHIINIGLDELEKGLWIDCQDEGIQPIEKLQKYRLTIHNGLQIHFLPK